MTDDLAMRVAGVLLALAIIVALVWAASPTREERAVCEPRCYPHPFSRMSNGKCVCDMRTEER